MNACARCGQENPEGFRLCGMCGAPLTGAAPPAREERKVVTVLFADLVGFTSRAERLDPEDVRRTLSPYYARVRSELERYGGTVEKFIGDAVMAVFGAPVAHEDDAERAVRAGLAVKDAIADLNDADETLGLRVRIGINTGEALVSLGARPSEGEGMVAGDVVNTAARLQSAAPVDAVLVGEATYRATDRAIAYAPAEDVVAKGKAEPVHAWRALEARSRLGVDVARSASTPLAGRDGELGLLRDALARVRRERRVQLVTLVGVPGIGKSRLVLELLRTVDEDPELIVWRQGRSLPYGEGRSLWALAEMVKAQAGILETDDDAAASEKLASAVRALTGGDDAAWIERHLRPLAGLATADDGRATQEEAFAAWRRFLEAVAESAPAVLVFEDLHWADDALLDFVDHLVDWAGSVPLLVVCTARPELLARRSGWGGGKPNAATLSLQPLSDEDTARVLAGALGRSLLPAETQTALLARAGGNPLYAEEFARLAAERPGDLGSLPLPETVQGIIAARLDALDADDKALLQDGAVLGKVFWLEAVASFRSLERWEAERRLHALERRELVRRSRGSSVAGASEYAFSHGLVRDVAYAQIPRAKRAEKHRLAAEWIDGLAADRSEDRAELLAHHYLSALDLARAAGLETGTLAVQARAAAASAGERALALNAFSSAVRFYRDAVELTPPTDPAYPRLLLEYGRALAADERGDDELRAARDALLATGDVDHAALAEAILAELEWMRGALVLPALERAAALVADRPTSPAKAYVLANVSRYLMLAGHARRAVEVGADALATARSLGLRELEAATLNNVGCARVALGEVAGLEELEASIALAEEINSVDATRGYINLASCIALLGDLRRAATLHDRGLALAHRFGQRRGIRFLTAEAAIDRWYSGAWDDARRIADDFLAEVDSGAPHVMEGACRATRAGIRIARGEVASGVADLELALARVPPDAEPQIGLPARAFYAQLSLYAGRGDAADAALDQLLATVRAAEAPTFEYWCVPGVLALDARGRLDEFAAVDDARAIDSRWLHAARAYAQGQKRAAAELLHEIGSLPDEAEVRVRLAEDLVRRGARAEADAELGKALAFYRSVGATLLARRAEELLAATA